jgi:hypothetical protein
VANTAWSATDKTVGVTLSGSNLTATNAAGVQAVRAVDKQITGKFYWEVTLTSATNNYGVGCANPNAVLSTLFSAPANAIIVFTSTGAIWIDNAASGSTLGALTAGGIVLCLAVDLTNRLFWARSGAAGNWNGSASANPATAAGGLSFGVGGIGIPFYPAACSSGVSAVTANFGDTAFTGAVPAGFTSGFTSGVTSPTNAIATQSALEHFFATNPPAQVTQVTIEQWATTATVSGQAMVTQVALEQWVPSPKLTVDLVGNLGGVSSYGRLSYGSKTYSRINAFTPIFGADLDVHVSLIDLRGEIAPQIALGGSLSLLVPLDSLLGSFGFSVVYGASSFISGPLWAGSEPCPTPPWAESEPCPPPPWMTSPPCEPVAWSKTRLCNG